MKNEGQKKQTVTGAAAEKADTPKELVFDKVIKSGAFQAIAPQFLMEEKPPEWVLKVGLELMKVYLPGVEITKETKESPMVMGALMGNMMRRAKDMTPSRISVLNEFMGGEFIGKNLRPMDEPKPKIIDNELFENTVPPVLAIAKEALAGAVNLPADQMAEFMKGFEIGVKGGSMESIRAHREFTTVVYLCLFSCWKEVEKLRSSTELRKWLLDRVPEINVGSESRIKKLCLRIGLKFRDRGRPRKTEK